jgi:hypothetical protein
MKEFVITATVTTFIIAATVLGIICGSYYLETVFDKTYCTGTINGVEVVNEPGWNMNCYSKGSSTQCTIYTGNKFFRFPERHIVSDNVILDCKLK